MTYWIDDVVKKRIKLDTTERERERKITPFGGILGDDLEDEVLPPSPPPPVAGQEWGTLAGRPIEEMRLPGKEKPVHPWWEEILFQRELGGERVINPEFIMDLLSLPVFAALPAAGAVRGALAPAARGGSWLAQIGKTALAPVEFAEKAMGLPFKVLGKLKPTPKKPPPKAEPIIEKLKGAVDYAFATQKQTRRLYRKQLGEKAGRIEEIFTEKEGISTYFKSLRALKGKLQRGEFQMPKELQFTKAETDSLLNMIYDKPLRSFEKERASTAMMKLSGLLKDETTGEIMQLQKNELKLLAEAFPELRPIVSAYRTLGVKAWDKFIDAANLPRALLASGELSGTLRQGGILLARRPQLFPSTMNWQFKTLFSSKNWQVLDDVIRADPDFAVFNEFGGYMAPEPGKVAVKLWEREEVFMSNLADKIPFVKMSERAFTAGLNHLRFQTFKRNMVLLRKMGMEANEDAIEGMVKLSNWASGRGSYPGALKETAPILNALMFSPRLVFSRFQLPTLMFSSNPAVRKEAIRTMVQFMGFGTGLLSLASLAGATVEIDPRSSEFGKLKIGDTRLDIWTGYVQWARFLAQFVTAERKITATGGKGEVDRFDALIRIAQSKASPIASILIDLMKGETYMGEPMFEGGAETVWRELRNRLTPLFAQDLWDAIELEGLAGGLAATPGALGIGVVSYEQGGFEYKRSGLSGIYKTGTGGGIYKP